MLISWLKETRLKKSLSMRDLAELINQPHSFVGKIETLERRLDVYEYVIYCEALQVNPTVGLRYLSGK
jgi:transcriptional regulator with XRE-family HTH domain